MKCKFAQHTCIQTITHTVQTRAQTHEHTCLDTHIHTHTHICVQTTHTHTRKRARKHTDIYTRRTLEYKHTRAHTRLQSHTNTNTYLHSVPLYVLVKRIHVGVRQAGRVTVIACDLLVISGIFTTARSWDGCRERGDEVRFIAHSRNWTRTLKFITQNNRNG